MGSPVPCVVCAKSIYVYVVLSAAMFLSIATAKETSEDRFPAVTLVTQNGKEVEFYKDLIKDKIVIINFMYTECKGLCEETTDKLAEVQKALGKRLGRDVFMYSITLDPEHDTAEVLKKYADGHGVRPGWTFLTGKADDIEALRQVLGLAERSAASRAELELPAVDSDAQGGTRKHTGMIAIGYDAVDRWHQTSIRSSPEQILQMVDRLLPPSQRKD